VISDRLDETTSEMDQIADNNTQFMFAKRLKQGRDRLSQNQHQQIKTRSFFFEGHVGGGGGVCVCCVRV
jgi:hypothetical protein